ncbi:MAG: GntR family transcriptional regulator [Myxococcales bacterium]|nr:GntR family transcriptional regulator [Myxococcales bacterium]MCB9662417.1 GntR family transcriptional regulator [Sandaracinaceae bacterium]
MVKPTLGGSSWALDRDASLALNVGDAEQSTSLGRADSLAHDLALRILRGENQPDALLPSVRSLAEQHSMTPPTVQRALCTLHGMGLVRATHGRGVEVQNPNSCCSPRLAPLRFEAVADDADASVKLLERHLDMRLDLAGLLVARFDAAEAIRNFALPLARVTTADTEVARMEADLGLNDTAVQMVDNFLAGAALRCLEAVVREVPGVAVALYGDGDMYTQSMNEAVRGIAMGGDGGWHRARAAVLRWHAHSIERYKHLMAL